MLDSITKEVTKEMDSLSDTDLRNFYFDRRVDELRKEFNEYINRQSLDLLRDVASKIRERKTDITNSEHITFLFNLYELFMEETWKLLGDRKDEKRV